MNKVILMGRLTRDAEIRYSQGESSSVIARFTLAVDRRFHRNNEDQTADFISCVAFGKTAEFLEKFGKKGVKFALEGRIQTLLNRQTRKIRMSRKKRPTCVSWPRYSSGTLSHVMSFLNDIQIRGKLSQRFLT